MDVLAPLSLSLVLMPFIGLPGNLFEFHPVLVIIGVVILMPFGMSLLNRKSRWFNSIRFKIKDKMNFNSKMSIKTWYDFIEFVNQKFTAAIIVPLLLSSANMYIRLHWILELVSAFCMAIGVLVVYLNKNRYSKLHFTTWHGCFGLVALIHSWLQLLAGLLLHWNFTKRYLITPFLSYSRARWYHAISGAILTVLVSFTLLLGLSSNWFQRNLLSNLSISQAWAIYFLFVLMIFWNAMTIIMQVFRRTNISLSNFK